MGCWGAYQVAGRPIEPGTIWVFSPEVGVLASVSWRLDVLVRPFPAPGLRAGLDLAHHGGGAHARGLKQTALIRATHGVLIQ